jgi:hypothetical protein
VLSLPLAHFLRECAPAPIIGRRTDYQGRFGMDQIGLDASRTVFVMVVGPGESEIALDSLDRIAAFEPEAEAWVLDDCTDDGTYEALVRWGRGHARSRILQNPESRGYRGIARSMFGMLSEIAAEPGVPGLVVKIDPDTCLLAPGVCDLMRGRLAAGGAGMVGAYRMSPTGAMREFGRIRRNMLLDLLPVGLHKDRQSVRVGRPYWAPFVSRARRNGYELGEHVLGALSGLHGATLRGLRDAGFLAIPDDYRALTVEEDVLLGLGAKAIGHQLMDINADPAKPDVWIQFRPPVPIGADELLRRGIRAVHPVKMSADGRAMRANLSLRRTGAAVPA